jgi:hypothetical protein
MSLQHAAQHLAAHGRGPDTTLVHMTKGEVKSLNDIAMANGGHLTINPHTGLPEAGFLSRMLPMIAGAGLMAVSGGAINPMTAGLLVGGGTAVATGDIKKGLMAGLGAYGGAGIGSALAASGGAAAGTAGTAAGTASTAGTAGAAGATPIAPVVPVAGPYASQAASQAASAPVGVDALTNAPLSTASRVPLGPNLNPQYTDVSGNLVTAPPVQPVVPNSMASNFRNSGNQMIEGFKSLGTEGGPTKFYENLGNVKYTYGPKTTLAAAALPLLMPDDKKREEEKTDSDPGQQYTFEANATNPTPTPDPYGREQKYYNQRYVPRAAGGGMMAGGGISHLGDYSDGGRLLRGPGDGVSDSIPAVIGKRQPARLADGEFVVPARIVSELGNGSTEAGARKLYAMMDRIQKARSKTVGKGKVAKNSRSEKYLPA